MLILTKQNRKTKMNTNIPIHPKSIIRYHWVIAVLLLPLLAYMILIQGPAAKLSAVEIPMSLLIGPAVSVHQPAAQEPNPPMAWSVIDDTFDQNFEYLEEIDTFFAETAPIYEADQILRFVSSVEKFALEYQTTIEEDADVVQTKKTAKIPKKPGPEDRFMPIIMQAAHKYEVDPAIIKAIIKAESSYNPKAISNRGAQGLMQLMPNTARALGVTDSFCPEQNILGGVKYFKQLLDQFKGDMKLALAAYNAGSRKVRKYKGIPPFKTTRLYIKKVFEYHQEYQQQVTENG